MYDNSETKEGRQPDYVCKDPQCRKGVWISDTERNASQGATEQRPEHMQDQPLIKREPRKLLVIDKAMELAIKAAKRLAHDEFRKMDQDVTRLTDDLIVNLATTMYISRTRDRVGVFKAEKEALAGAQTKATEAAREAERRRREEEERARTPYQFDPSDPMDSPDDDDNLPF